MQIWMILAAIAVAAAGICLLIRSILHGRSCCGTHDAAPGRTLPADRDLSHYPYCYTAEVDGMVCGHCVRNVENAFLSAEMLASADLAHKSVQVYAKRRITRKEAANVLAGAGYTLIDFKEEAL